MWLLPFLTRDYEKFHFVRRVTYMLPVSWATTAHATIAANVRARHHACSWSADRAPPHGVQGEWRSSPPTRVPPSRSRSQPPSHALFFVEDAAREESDRTVPRRLPCGQPWDDAFRARGYVACGGARSLPAAVRYVLPAAAQVEGEQQPPSAQRPLRARFPPPVCPMRNAGSVARGVSRPPPPFRTRPRGARAFHLLRSLERANARAVVVVAGARASAFAVDARS